MEEDSTFPGGYPLEFAFLKDFQGWQSLTHIPSSTPLKFQIFFLTQSRPIHIWTVSYFNKPASLHQHPSKVTTVPVILFCSSWYCMCLPPPALWECCFPAQESLVGLAQLHSVKRRCLRAACIAGVFTLSGSLMDVARACCRFKYFSYVCLRILLERMDMLPALHAWGGGGIGVCTTFRLGLDTQQLPFCLFLAFLLTFSGFELW